MTALLNVKREAFAALVAGDCPVTEAFERAGFKPDRSNAAAMARRPDVSNRISEIRLEALSSRGWTAERIVSELSMIAGATYDDIVGDDGKLRAGARMTAAQKRAVSSVEVTTDAKGRQTVRVRFADKLKALEMLAKYAGLERQQETAPVNIYLASPIEIIRDKISELSRRHTPTIEHFPVEKQQLIERIDS